MRRVQSLTHFLFVIVILTFTAFIVGIQSGEGRAVAVTSFEERKGRLTEEQFDSLLNKAKWPRDLWAEVKEVASCESAWYPNAINNDTGDYGLLQINFGYHGKRVLSKEDFLDPLLNLVVGKLIFEEAKGWKPWSSSNKCHRLLG